MAIVTQTASPDLHPLAAELARRFPQADADYFAVVDVTAQRLYGVVQGESVDVFEVSTAATGMGNRLGTEQTPLGVFRVAAKYGDDAPVGTVYKGRVATGEVARIHTDPDDPPSEDLITTRILWLDGLQPGLNRGGEVDTFARYIYIHGTPDEGRIGTPASHGCVRMRNADVVALYDRLAVDSLVCIVIGGGPSIELSDTL